MNEVGARIAERRKEMNLSLRDLGQRVGKSSGYLSRVERGVKSPSLDLLLSLAAVLGVTVLWLTTGEWEAGCIYCGRTHDGVSILDAPLTSQAAAAYAGRPVGEIEQAVGKKKLKNPLTRRGIALWLGMLLLVVLALSSAEMADLIFPGTDLGYDNVLDLMS